MWIHYIGNMGKKIKTFIRSNIRILLPLAITTIAVVLFTGHIPYVNQYAQEFILLILVVEWFILKHFINISRLYAIKLALILFIVSFIFTFIGLQSYSEIIGNFIFALLLLNVVPLLLDKQS
jgi:uncharacterized membrane protein YGL010W